MKRCDIKHMKVAIVGIGNMGGSHLRICSEIKELEIVSISDINRDLGIQLAQQYNTKYTGDYRDLVKLNPDFVCIVVPTFLHYEVCKYFIENNINVLLEKPVTKELWEAEELIKLAELYNVKVLVGHIERFNGVYNTLKNSIVERNEDIIAIEINRLSHNDRIVDVSVVLDLMIHDIDLMLDINKFNIDKIKSIEYSNDGKNSLDYCISIFKFCNNSIGKITSSRITEQKIREIIITTNKSFYYANLLSKEIVISNKTQLSYNNNALRQENIIQKIFVQENNALKDEILHFIDVIKFDKQPLVDLKQGYNVLKYAYDIINSCN